MYNKQLHYLYSGGKHEEETTSVTMCGLGSSDNVQGGVATAIY